MSGQVSGVSGPRGVPSAVCGGGGAPALKFLFCEQSLAPPQLPSRLPAALPPSPFPSLFTHRTPRHPPAQTCCRCCCRRCCGRVSGRRGGGRRGGGSADPRFLAGSLVQDPNYWLKAPRSVSVQEGLCVHVPCSVSYPQKGWNNSDPEFQKPATDSKNRPVTMEIWQWPQTTQSMQCSVRPRADSSSLETPRPKTAPWRSETPRGGIQGHTSLGWREGLL